MLSKLDFSHIAVPQHSENFWLSSWSAWTINQTITYAVTNEEYIIIDGKIMNWYSGSVRFVINDWTTNIFDETVQTRDDRSFYDLSFNKQVSIEKQKTYTIKVYLNTAYNLSSRPQTTSGVIYFSAILIGNLKKCRVFDNKNIWYSINAYTFWRLPNGEWRDGN